LRVVSAKATAPATAAQLEVIREHAGRILVDVGTGDARTAYRYARATPDRLVVALDPAWPRMVEIAGRAARKPAKGGTANLLLVAASIEDAPDELAGVADEVWVLMPWGKLLVGVVRGDADVCAGLARLAVPGARLEVQIATSIWREPVPLEIVGLPEATPEYVEATLAGRLAEAGWTGAAASYLSETDQLASSWGRRLSAGGPERILKIVAVRAGA
jgi:16S rRNA (adenine(1408)-N(1))-methyltransferase